MPELDSVQEWLDRFTSAAQRADRTALGELLADPVHWRDNVALTWAPHTFNGREQVIEALLAAPLTSSLTLQLDPSSPPRVVTRAGRDCVEAILKLGTAAGTGTAILRLEPATDDSEPPRAWMLGTVLRELRGHEERSGRNRPDGRRWSRSFSGPNWAEQRAADVAQEDPDPAVLVVGGGQAGLATAARLQAYGVDALVIDPHERIGDNWRERYHSLTLHNETWVIGMPYLPFPDNWPTYIPKDKLAGWLEYYAEAMELLVWTQTELTAGSYDDARSQWTVQVRRDGTEHTLHPRHIVMATGTSGPPYIPDIPGLSDFTGTVVHSGRFTEAAEYAGKRAVVVGTGTSGHDVAQELYEAGATVTMVQRGKTAVASVGPKLAGRIYSLYDEGLSDEHCDMITAGTPFPITRWSQQLLTRDLANDERQLLDGLEAAGFRTSLGEDETGWQILYQTRGGGYYLNVGCSELIVDGKIGVLPWESVERVDSGGLRLQDGSMIDADLIVLATGYLGQDVVLRRIFGDDLAQRVGPVWGFNDEGELRNLWSPTGQRGLWFIAGSLAQCRIFSRSLALQIQARELAVIPPEYVDPQPGGALRAADLCDVEEALSASPIS